MNPAKPIQISDSKFTECSPLVVSIPVVNLLDAIKRAGNPSRVSIGTAVLHGSSMPFEGAPSVVLWWIDDSGEVQQGALAGVRCVDPTKQQERPG